MLARSAAFAAIIGRSQGRLAAVRNIAIAVAESGIAGGQFTTATGARLGGVIIVAQPIAFAAIAGRGQRRLAAILDVSIAVTKSGVAGNHFAGAARARLGGVIVVA